MNTRFYIIPMVAVLLTLWSIQSAIACTVFVLDDGSRPYYGSNFDWHRGEGVVLVNPRGKAKQGWPLPHDPGEPVQWRSEYGSLTFIQFGQGLPKGGMNEAGLVTESLLLPGSEYQKPDKRPYVGSSSQMNQYLLDTCATVADVVARLSRIRLATYDWAPGVHFMVADAGGDCAVIEFIRGRVKVYHGESLPLKALVNQAYDGSTAMGHSQGLSDFEFLNPAARRLRIVSGRLARYRTTDSKDTVADVLSILDAVSAGAFTQWQVVYDQKEGVAYWRCAPTETLRWIDLKKIDFGCDRPVLGLPIQRRVTGEANPHLSPFSADDNRQLVYGAVEGNQGVIPIPDAIRDGLWRFPQDERCVND